MHKRGYFFTLDAFIAMGLLAIGFVFLYLSQSFTPSTVQQTFIAQDLLQILTSTEIKEINSPFIDEQQAAGNITNDENSLLEQAGEWYYLDQQQIPANQKHLAQNLTQNMTALLVPGQFKYHITLDNAILANNTQHLREDVNSLSVAKTLLMGLINQTILWGPYEVEVWVWQ